MSSSASLSIEQPVSKNPSLQAWFVCLSAALFFFYEFIQMGMFNSLSPELMHDFGLSAVQLGNLSATYFYGDVVFLFFAGMLLDRFSPRFIIITAMTVCIAATVVFAMSSSKLVLGLSHFVSGIGNAFCFLSCIKLSSRWFPPQRMALIVGLSVTLAMAGGMVAQTPLTYLVQDLGWRHAVLVDAMLGVVILAIITMVVRDHPPTGDFHTDNNHVTSMRLSETVRLAISNPQNWLGGVYTSLVNLPIFLLGDLAGIMYLTQVHHIARTQASVITSMVFLGTIFGSPLSGWLSDFIGRRRMPMIVGAIASLVVMLSIMYLPGLGFSSLLILFFLLGLFTSTQIVSYPMIAESNPKVMTGTATGLASVLIMGGGAVFQPLFGWLMDKHWDGAVQNGVHVYSAHSYLWGMAIMPIAFAISLLAALLIRETYCQPYSHK